MKKTSEITYEWNLRDEILEIAHRWPQTIFSFLLGCLLGWGFTFFLPTSYRAESELFIAYNSDALYRNPDDYKNWQLGELEVLLFSQDMLQKTLDRLKPQDSFWASIGAIDLADMLHVYWRNAGKWRLVAESPRPELAAQLSQTWQAVILEETSTAIAHGNAANQKSLQLRALADAYAKASSRATLLTQVNNELLAWSDDLANKNPGLPLDPQDRWRLQSLVALTIQRDENGSKILEQTPPPNATLEEYTSWINLTLNYFAEEHQLIQKQLPELDSQFAALYSDWQTEINASRGLSAFLLVESSPEPSPPAQPIRYASWTALVGGLIGLLAWGLVQTARLTKWKK